jgi:hypothetical protein
MPLLTIKLQRVPNVLGIYGKSKDEFPQSASWLHPDAARGFAALQAGLGQRVRVSDVFRTAEQSLAARAMKSGVQPPGFSLHNYGIAIDIHTDAMLAALKLDKPALDKRFTEHGWFCHRKDGKRGMEDWHFNFLGVGDEAAPFLAASAKSSNTSAAGDAKIRAIHGDDLTLTPAEAQEALKKLRMYHGDLDGKFGPRSQQALMVFQRAWKLVDSGVLDAKTERTLAYVTANRVELDPASV